MFEKLPHSTLTAAQASTSEYLLKPCTTVVGDHGSSSITDKPEPASYHYYLPERGLALCSYEESGFAAAWILLLVIFIIIVVG